MKIKKVGILVPNFKDKKTYMIHIKNLNQALEHWFETKIGTSGY